MKMRVSVAALLMFINALTSIAVGQQGGGPASPQSKHVSGHGCVTAGNVSGCYVVNDYKAHVFFRQQAPDIDKGISFEGIAYGHRDPHCNQGQRVDVTEWKPLASECPKQQQ